MVKRIETTVTAAALIAELYELHGDLMFYQAGGCCEGTQPLCLNKGGILKRLGDVCIGHVGGFEFWMDKDLFEYWKHAHCTLDVVEGYGTGGFSLEVPLGKTFKMNYRVFTAEEESQLEPLVAIEN